MTYIYLRVLAKSSQVSLHFDVVVPLIACSFYHSSHFHGSCSMRPFERTLLFDNGVKRFADRNRNREGTKTKQQSTSKPNRRGLPLTAPTSNLSLSGENKPNNIFCIRQGRLQKQNHGITTKTDNLSTSLKKKAKAPADPDRPKRATVVSLQVRK